MKKALRWMAASAALIFAGCSTPIPPGAERGPHGTMAYDMLIDASPPGARVEVNGEDVGATPVHIKLFGDPDGTFHDFGSDYYIVRALPVTTNQFAQTRVFRTGHMLGPEDHIPQQIFFDMNHAAPPPPVVYGGPGYYGPPPMYWGPDYYWGPRFYFRVGPHYHHRW